MTTPCTQVLHFLTFIIAVESDDVEEVVLEEFDPSYHRSQGRNGRGQAYEDDDDEDPEGQGGGVRCQQQ